MLIRLGFEMVYQCPQPTPMILALSVHYSRASDLRAPDLLRTLPAVPVSAYRDLFGNWCSRLVAPPGRFVISTDAFVNDSGLPDAVVPTAAQVPVPLLPEATLVYLLGSRYCETDQLSDIAWQRFGNGPSGWARVQAICDFVHGHIEFGYQHARRTRTAWEAYVEGVGVCRDYAHLAIALCRCMNIPARYCTGYLGDYGTPPPYGTMDFAGWFEAYLGDRWYPFDARNNTPRIGRVLIARGRDACDVALASTFGPNTLEAFKVWCDVVDANTASMAPLMTYCVGVKLDQGLILASDSRTHAGVDNYAKFCKMTVFECAGERVLVLLSSGGLAGTQAVINVLQQQAAAEPPNLWSVASMFDVAMLVSDAMRAIERRDAPYLEEGGLKFNASFILGGQIAGEDMRLFRIYAEGNFIEAGSDTNFLQTGEAKYGKPILDLGISSSVTLDDATKCVLVSFDSTMLSNLSVGMPIDLLCYERDSLRVSMRRRFDSGDAYFESLKQQWIAGTRRVFHELPPLAW